MNTKIKYITGSIICLFIATAPDSVNAQHHIIGIGNSFSVSGSGYGLLLSPNVIAGVGRSYFAFGPTFQNQGRQLTGIKGVYRITISDVRDISWVHFYYNIYYHNSGKFSVIKEHTYVPDITQKNLDRESYTTLEQYVGFGVKTTLFENLFFEGNIGFGYFHTKGNEQYYKNRTMDYARIRNDVMMSIKLGISIEYKLNWKSNTPSYVYIRPPKLLETAQERTRKHLTEASL